MATINLLKKLGFLTVLGTMDCWRFLLTIKNLAKTFTVSASSDMTALRKTVNGQLMSDRVSSGIGVSNIFDMLIIIFISTDRLCRVAFKLNALQWEAFSKGTMSGEPPFVEYVFAQLVLKIFPIFLFNYITLLALDGYHIRRKVMFVKDVVEIVLVVGWITILFGLANNEVLDSWVFFAVGVVVAIEGYAFWFICLAVDGGLFYYELENKMISDKLKILWDFPPENVKISERNNWEVKYVGAFGHDVLLMDTNVVLELRPEHVCALASLELGQWYYRHSVFYYALPILQTAALGSLLMLSYNNPVINSLFGFTEEPDPSVPMFNAYMWIWPSILDVISYIDSLLSSWTVLRGDKLALERHNAEDLAAALNHIAGTTELYPIYDGFYAAWMLGRPTVRTRIQKLKSAVRMKS